MGGGAEDCACEILHYHTHFCMTTPQILFAKKSGRALAPPSPPFYLHPYKVIRQAMLSLLVANIRSLKHDGHATHLGILLLNKVKGFKRSYYVTYNSNIATPVRLLKSEQSCSDLGIHNFWHDSLRQGDR